MEQNIGLMKVLNTPKTELSNTDQTAKLIHNAKVVGECYRVRVLFDSEHLKNDADYVSIIEDTWLRAFDGVCLELLEEAVHEFIISDKKGYLPKPGQIVELLVKGVKDIESRRYYAKLERLERERLFAKYSNDTTVGGQEFNG